MVFQLIGGIGLFLLGMVLLTDGLKAFAGDSLRQALLRFTGRPVTAFCSGAAVTAMVQSSSATTLTTIGFVSAGLVTFPQAIGILFGASLGTTSTGWIVSTIGLKFSIGALALPLTGVGAFMRLLGRGRTASLGIALAGFGLIFIGIDTLQDGMRDLSEMFDLSAMAFRGLLGHFLLMLVGIAMTVIMQSSSAAVATTLAALHAGAIDFEQAASLVIGQAIGTTVTAALVMIGATVPAKRAALAHILFNAATGLVALVLLPVFLFVFNRLEGLAGETPGPISLAAFHTSFIALGVLIFLPFTGAFARFIEWLLPDKGISYTRHLDHSLYNVPAVAVEAALNALKEILREECRRLHGYLMESKPRPDTDLIRAVEETGSFVAGIPTEPGEPAQAGKRVNLFHAIDHLTQLMLLPPPPGLERFWSTDAFQPVRNQLEAALETAFEALDHEPPAADHMQAVSLKLAELRKTERSRLLEHTAEGRSQPEATLRLLDAIRYGDTLVYHLWRIINHLETAEDREP